MATPLYNTDIIPLTSRPTLNVMDDGDYFVILDTSTGKISKILRTNIQKALNISYDNTTSGLTADTVQAALDELVVNLGSTNTVIESLKGVGWTDENLVDHEERLDTLEGTGAGSIAKAIEDAVSPVQAEVDNNRLYSDSQYLALKAQADAQALEIQASRAELYNGYKILQFGSTDIIGKGTKADYSAIDVSANVVDGKLDMEQKGLTITNLVDGADIADSGTVSFNTVNGDKYFDTLNETIITGDGTEMSATNSSGATANMAIYHLNALGLDHITDTAILAKLLPYVDGTKNVGKMGVQILDADDNVTQTIFLPAIGNSLPNGVADSIKTIADGWEHTKRVGVGALGAEKVTGGDMSNAGDWVVSHMDVNTTVAGKAYYPDTATGYIQQSMSIVSGKLYCVQFDLSNANSASITLATAGGLPLGSGIAFAYKTGLGNGHHTFYFVATSTQSAIRLYSTLTSGGPFELDNLSIKEIDTSTGSPYVSIDSTEVSNDGTNGYYQLATPITTHYDLPIPTSGKTIHRFAGEEKIALYGTGLTFTENVLSVLSAVKFVAGVMTDITSLATITGATVTFSGVNATDVVYVKVEHDVDRPLGILEHTPAVSNTASRLAALEAAVFGG